MQDCFSRVWSSDPVNAWLGLGHLCGVRWRAENGGCCWEDTLSVKRERLQPQCNPVRRSGAAGHGPDRWPLLPRVVPDELRWARRDRPGAGRFEQRASLDVSRLFQGCHRAPDRAFGDGARPPRRPPRRYRTHVAKKTRSTTRKPSRLQIFCGVEPRVPGIPLPGAWIAIWKISSRQCWFCTLTVHTVHST